MLFNRCRGPPVSALPPSPAHADVLPARAPTVPTSSGSLLVVRRPSIDAGPPLVSFSIKRHVAASLKADKVPSAAPFFLFKPHHPSTLPLVLTARDTLTIAGHQSSPESRNNLVVVLILDEECLSAPFSIFLQFMSCMRCSSLSSSCRILVALLPFVVSLSSP
jgi:hypothetical protein